MPLPPILTDSDSVARLAADLAKESVIAVDLEADSLHSYQEKVCLLQFSSPSKTLLVDPLAGCDLSPLGKILADGGVRKIFHAADYDIRCLHRDFGFEVRGLFDTMVSSQLLGEEKVGLADVLRKHFAIELDKQYQRADWSIRPLSEGMVRYAAEDTRYLHRLVDLLEGMLKEKDRLDWAEEEFAFIEEGRFAPSEGPLFPRVKGAGALDRRQLAILENLLQWRDAEARRLNRPPFKILGNNALMEVARRSPRNLQGMVGIEGLSPRHVDRYGRQILSEVTNALAISTEDLPVFPRQPRREKDPAADLRLAALKKWRQTKASEFAIDPGVLINNALLETLARTLPKDPDDLEGVSGMKRWQRRVLGKEILRVLAR